ncbi:hypothetical protein FNV43_RR19507 [Rhamnella rubrinervis]|uniref:Cytochrome P450 n=1 Tax=Rhamnella rubrinervis TaxID=2594499 RepID=A0A8K0DXX8_9ROSA|nr:hypothetical protein FNV43_RR19507 [Rhamnella rubrinervis]
MKMVWHEEQLLSTFFQNPFLIVSVFLISLVLLFIQISRRSNDKLNLPPSPPRLPIIGNLHQLGSLLHQSLQQLSQIYGPDLLLLHLGQTPTIVVSSADLVREMIKSHDVVFSNRSQSTATDFLLYGSKDVSFSNYGEYWRQVRKVIVVELLSTKRVQQFQFVRDEEVTMLVNKVHKASLNGDSINLSDMFFGTSNNIVSRIVIGQSIAELEDGKSTFGELSKRLMSQLVEFSVGDFFPRLKWIDVVRGFIGRLKSTFVELDSFFDEVIEQHEALLESDHDCGSDSNKDFVNILLRLRKDGMLDFEFTRNDLKALLVDMFLGASDTTSTTLEWLMAELMKNPNVMNKAQEEVRRVVGEKSNIDMNDINEMSYLKCVIKENLRLHPAAPLLVPRETMRDVEIGGYHIAAKTKVVINAWAIQRDTRSWDSPEKFIPERFENSDVDFKLPGGALGEDLDMSEVNALTVTKKLPLRLLPIPCDP